MRLNGLNDFNASFILLLACSVFRLTPYASRLFLLPCACCLSSVRRKSIQQFFAQRVFAPWYTVELGSLIDFVQDSPAVFVFMHREQDFFQLIDK